jgi:hypothetical protein
MKRCHEQNEASKPGGVEKRFSNWLRALLEDDVGNTDRRGKLWRRGWYTHTGIAA